MSEDTSVFEQFFKDMDKNGDGYISLEEFKSFVVSMGMNSDEEAVKAALMKADENGDGVMDMQEFIKIMSSV